MPPLSPAHVVVAAGPMLKVPGGYFMAGTSWWQQGTTPMTFCTWRLG
jgi:hypothetical protein